MHSCKNCTTKFEGNFCPNCGQRPNSGRIILRESVRDVLENYFDFDAPLFRTIGRLITNPGKTIREYIQGRRKSYSHPFRYFIFILAIFLIVKKLIGFDPIEVASSVLGAREMPNPDALVTKGANYFSEHINSFLLIYAFTIAIFSKLFNLKSKVYFVEYLSLGFFTVSEYIFFSTIILLLSLLSPNFFILNYILILLYPAYVLVSFHDGNLFSRMIKALFASFFAWILYAFLGFSISIFIVSYFNL